MKKNLPDDPLTGLKRRLFSRWFEDGLYEVFLGGVLMVMGITLVLNAKYGQTTKYPYLNLLVPIILIGSIYGGGRLLKWVKENYVYPITGYIKYKKPPLKRRIPRFLIVFTCVSIPLVLFAVFRIERYEVVVSGGALVYIMTTLFFYTRLPRFLFLDIVSIAGTVLIFLNDELTRLGIGATYVAIAPFLLLSGLITYRRFRRLINPDGTNQLEDVDDSV